MELSHVIALVAVIIAALTYVTSRIETGKIRSNCIATLTKDVENINKKLDTLKVDAVLEKFNHISEQLQNGCKRFNDADRKLEKMHDEVLELRLHADTFVERLSRLYARMDMFEVKVRQEMKDKGN